MFRKAIRLPFDEHTHLHTTLSKHTHLVVARCLSPTHSRNMDEKAGTTLTLR